MKNHFIKTRKKYYFGKQVNGCPYFYPWNYVPYIFNFHKKEPFTKRSKLFKINFLNKLYYIEFGSPIKWHSTDIGWKDKYNSPRFEWAKQFGLYFFGFEFHWWDLPPVNNIDLYFEMKIWTEHYCNNDLSIAEETWGWLDSKTKKSTWNNNYIK